MVSRDRRCEADGHRPPQRTLSSCMVLVHQDHRIAIASNFGVDRAKSTSFPEKERVWCLEIAARNPKDRWQFSIASLNRNAALLYLVSEIASKFWPSAEGIAIANRRNHAISVRCTNGGFRLVVQVLCGDSDTPTPFRTSINPFLPQSCLILSLEKTYLLPQSVLCFAGNLQPRLETTTYTEPWNKLRSLGMTPMQEKPSWSSPRTTRALRGDFRLPLNSRGVYSTIGPVTARQTNVCVTKNVVKVGFALVLLVLCLSFAFFLAAPCLKRQVSRQKFQDLKLKVTVNL